MLSRWCTLSNVYLLTWSGGAFEGSYRIVTSTTQALDLAQYSVLTSLAEPGHCYTAGYLPESSCWAPEASGILVSLLHSLPHPSFFFCCSLSDSHHTPLTPYTRELSSWVSPNSATNNEPSIYFSFWVHECLQLQPLACLINRFTGSQHRAWHLLLVRGQAPAPGATHSHVSSARCVIWKNVIQLLFLPCSRLLFTTFFLYFVCLLIHPLSFFLHLSFLTLSSLSVLQHDGDLGWC